MGLELEEDQKRRPVALALAAGRKRQSPQTGFIHYCYGQAEGRSDTIPLLENFCFALALLRSRLSENMLEAKALIEKLLAFEVTGNFPIYLHEFPQCRDWGLAHRILPVFRRIETEFSPLLGEELTQKIKAIMQRIENNEQKLEAPKQPASPADWSEVLVDAPDAAHKAAEYWHPTLFTFIGPQGEQFQEKNQPAITLYDLFMGQLFRNYSKRALEDHPVHLRAALVPAYEAQMPPSASDIWLQSEPGMFTLLWGGAEHTHSLVCRSEAFADFMFNLPDPVPDEGDKRMEIALFCDIHPDHTLLVDGERATTFQLGECVEIISKNLKIVLKFELTQGSGVFFGHLSRSNRPRQLSCKGEDRFEAFDWQIGLRTIARSPDCRLKLNLDIQKL